MLTPKSELAKLCIRVLPLALGLQACASKSGQRSGQGLASGAPAKPAANGRAAAPKPRQLDEAVDAYMRAATAHDAASARSLFERAIRLFEAATGERARLTFTGPLGVPLESLTYTPEGELVGIGRGVILRISSKDLWTLRRWQPLENTFRAQLIASSPDGGLAAYSDFESGRYTITLFDTRTAERRFELEGRSTAPGADVLWPYARAISFLPDGARLACASDGGRISFWDLASRSEVGHFVAPVNGFAFSHDGRLLATGEDILAYVRAADTGAPVHELGKHTSGVGALAFSRDDKVLYTADNAGWVRLWDPRSGRLLRRIAAHRNFVVHGIIPLDDNQRFVTTSRDGTALLWHRKRDKPVVVVKRSAGITAATLTSNQQALVTASSDGTLRVSDLASGREQRQLLHLVVAPTALAFPSNDRLVIATANGANTLDLSSGAWARVKGLPERIAALARSASGGVVALTEGFTLSTYERDADGYRSGAATQLKPLPMFHEVPSVLPRDVEQAGDTLAALAGNALYVWKGVGRELSFRAVSYDATDLGLARDGSAAALAFPDHVKLISIPSGGVIFEQVERDSKNKRQPGFAAVALSSDGQEVVAARGNGELLVYDRGGKEIARRTLKAAAMRLVPSSKPHTFWAALSDGGIALLEPDANRAAYFEGSRCLPSVLALSPDERLIALSCVRSLSSFDTDVSRIGSLRVWSFDGTRAELIAAFTQTEGIEGALVSLPDGRFDFIGPDASRVVLLLRCAVGAYSLPFQACANRYQSAGPLQNRILRARDSKQKPTR